jgi:hypothetical protein
MHPVLKFVLQRSYFVSYNHFSNSFALLSIGYWLSDNIWTKKSKVFAGTQTVVCVMGILEVFILFKWEK